MKTRSGAFPHLCEERQLLSVRDKECRKRRRQEEWSLSQGRLKSQRRVRGLLSVGKRLNLSISSRRSARGTGGW